jgi:hypothetical protein
MKLLYYSIGKPCFYVIMNFTADYKLQCNLRTVTSGRYTTRASKRAYYRDLCAMRQRTGTNARFERKAKRKAKSWRNKDCCATLKARAKIEVRPFLM